MRTVLLDRAKHNRCRFNCGIESLNNYFKVIAHHQAQQDSTRTFVLEDKTNESHIVGFYTLTMTQIDTAQIELKTISRKKKSYQSVSGGLITRLAIDERYKGKRFGEWLLIDALNKLYQASNNVGFPVIIVNTKNGASSFYKKYGFTTFQDSDTMMFMTLTDIRAIFE